MAPLAVLAMLLWVAFAVLVAPLAVGSGQLRAVLLAVVGAEDSGLELLVHGVRRRRAMRGRPVMVRPVVVRVPGTVVGRSMSCTEIS